MTDIMVDTETTGVDPGNNAIIQLAAIKFNYDTGEVGGHFDRCPMPLPRRFWHDSTREFWLGKNRPVYTSIVSRAEPAETVFSAFVDWVRSDDSGHYGYRFWAKPLSFDWPFVSSHLEQLRLPNPFHFRYARDLNSFMAALNGSAEHNPVEDVVPFPAQGKKHNALHDNAWQIDQLLYAKRNSKCVT